MEATVDPGLARLREDIQSPAFLYGVDEGWWRVVGLEWPILVLAVRAHDGNELGMRVDLTGYPTVAPAGQPWDLDANCPLPYRRWPKGPTQAQVFRANDWSVTNGNSPYMATERNALKWHPEWVGNFPERAWTPSRHLDFYVQQLRNELRSATLPGPDA